MCERTVTVKLVELQGEKRVCIQYNWLYEHTHYIPVPEGEFILIGWSTSIINPIQKSRQTVKGAFLLRDNNYLGKSQVHEIELVLFRRNKAYTMSTYYGWSGGVEPVCTRVDPGG